MVKSIAVLYSAMFENLGKKHLLSGELPQSRPKFEFHAAGRITYAP